MAVFKYENGVSFAKVNTTEISGFARRQIVVSGTGGTVEIKPIEESVADVEYGITAYKRENYELQYFGCKENERVKSEVFTRYGKMLKSFAEYVRGEKTNPYTLDYELELYKTILKACGVS